MLIDTPNLIQWTDPADAAFTVIGIAKDTNHTTIDSFGTAIKLLKPLDLSVWLTAQRPALDASGHIIGFASDTGQLELWDGVQWSQVPTLIAGALTGVAGAFTTLSASTSFTVPSLASPPNGIGALSYNTGTGRFDFGLGGSVVNHVRLSGDALGTSTFTGGTFNGSTWSGGTFSGTIAGTPTLSGNYTSSGVPTFSGGSIQISTTAVVGTNTTAQTLRLNGAAGSARALEWASAGVKRYHVQPNGSDNLQMLAYDSGGLNPLTVWTITNTTGALNFSTSATFSQAFTLQPPSITYAGSDSGTPGSTQPYFASQVYAGSTTSSFNPIYNLTKIFDNVATPNDSAGSDMISFQGIPGGTAVNAGRRLLLLTMAPSAMVNSVGEFTTLQPKMFVNAASNGASAWSINSTVEIKSTSSGWVGAIGHETDIYVEAGATQPLVKMFQFWHLVPNDAQQGSLTDAFAVADAGPSTGLTNTVGTMRALLQVMKNGASQWPLDSTAGELLAVGQQTQTNANSVAVRPNAMLRGLNFSKINFSDAALWWPGGWLGGDGTTRLNRLQISAGTNGPLLDAPLYKATSCGVSVAGTHYAVGDQVYPAGLAGMIHIDSVDVNGGVLTCSWLHPAYSTTNPATASTTGGTGPSQNGVAFVATIGWTLASLIQIGASVNTVIGTGAAGATTDTLGHLMIPFCAGAPTGVPTNASSAIALRYDTTNHKLWAYDNAASAWKGVALT